MDQKTFINCDIRYFSLDYLVENVGSFDSNYLYFLLISYSNGSAMENSRCSIDGFAIHVFQFTILFRIQHHVQLRNHESKNRKTLQQRFVIEIGFLFLWILNTQIISAYEILNSWGYEVVD